MPPSASSSKEGLARLVLTPQQQKSRRARNIAIGLAVGALVLLFYVITIVKLGSHVFTMFDGS